MADGSKWSVKTTPITTTNTTTTHSAFFSSKRSVEATRCQRLARNKRKRAQKKQLKEDDHKELMQEKCKRLATKEKLVLAEKNKEKFYQIWRQTEREKEKLFQFQMTMDKKSTNKWVISNYSSTNAVGITSLLEIAREAINLEADSKDITLGEGKFGKVTLASYRGMPVAVKQFNGDVSLSEIKHEENIISAFKHLNLPVLFGISCQEKHYLLMF